MESKAIDLILERGVRFRLTAPRWKRWLGLDFLTIKPPKTGSVLLIAGEMLRYELGAMELLLTEKPTQKQFEGVARVVAIAVLGRRATYERRVNKLSERLRREVQWASLLELYAVVEQMLRVEDFQRTTVSLASKVLTMMRVKEKKGS